MQYHWSDVYPKKRGKNVTIDINNNQNTFMITESD